MKPVFQTFAEKLLIKNGANCKKAHIVLNSANFEQKTEIEKTGSGSCHDRARFHSEYRKDEN